MYDKVSTNIHTPVGMTESFTIKVGLHQGSAPSPFIFTVIMEEISISIWETVPWCMLLANDIVLVAEKKRRRLIVNWKSGGKPWRVRDCA